MKQVIEKLIVSQLFIKFHATCRTRKVHYYGHKSLPLVPWARVCLHTFRTTAQKWWLLHIVHFVQISPFGTKSGGLPQYSWANHYECGKWKASYLCCDSSDIIIADPVVVIVSVQVCFLIVPHNIPLISHTYLCGMGSTVSPNISIPD